MRAEPEMAPPFLVRSRFAPKKGVFSITSRKCCAILWEASVYKVEAISVFFREQKSKKV